MSLEKDTAKGLGLKPGDDIIEHSGIDPRNDLPTATLKLKGTSDLIPIMRECRNTMVGVTFETGSLRFAFYVDTFDSAFGKGWRKIE